MRILLLAVGAVFSLSLSLGQVRAEEPNLLGTWSGETRILLVLDGEIVKVPRLMTLVFEEVEGNTFVGFHSWQALTDSPGNVAGEDVLGASEPVIGVIDSDGVTLHFVETGDRGVMLAELLGPDRLEFTYLETWPHAVAYSLVMERQGD